MYNYTSLSFHQPRFIFESAMHLLALRLNVSCGVYYACVKDHFAILFIIDMVVFRNRLGKITLDILCLHGVLSPLRKPRRLVAGGPLKRPYVSRRGTGISFSELGGRLRISPRRGVLWGEREWCEERAFCILVSAAQLAAHNPTSDHKAPFARRRCNRVPLTSSVPFLARPYCPPTPVRPPPVVVFSMLSLSIYSLLLLLFFSALIYDRTAGE